MSANSTAYPSPQQTRLIAPDVLSLERVVWIPAGARVIGNVGGAPFDIAVTVADLLDRKRFSFCLWRFEKLLPILPSIESWQRQIAAAERRSV